MVRSLVNVVGRQSNGMKSEKENIHVYIHQIPSGTTEGGEE